MNEGTVLSTLSVTHGLVCPVCAGELQQTPDTLTCSPCGKGWPVVDGVPHFIRGFPYWGEIPLEQMKAVNAAAAVSAWRTPLLNTSDPVVRRAAEMILNLDRANWHLLANVPAGSRV